MNQLKTDIMQIGEKLNEDYTLLGLNWNKEKIYDLGTWFYEDIEKSIKHTYDEKLEDVKNILNRWSKRHLTWIGKITVIKSLCIPKLNFSISSMEAPNWFINEVQSLLNNFIWSGKPPRVKNSVLCNDYEHGGLRMTNLEWFIDAQLLSWVNKIMNDADSLPANYIQSFLDMPLKLYLKCRINDNEIPKSLPTFYQNVLQRWFRAMVQPKSGVDVQREVLWKNKFLTVGGKSLFNKRLYNNGVKYICDLLDTNGKFLTHDSLISKYGNHISTFDYISLLNCIPQNWRKLLKQKCIVINPDKEPLTLHITNQSKPLSLISSKEIYWSMLNESYIRKSYLKPYN